jgi:uncharacterized paraquat-inducible protein A
MEPKPRIGMSDMHVCKQCGYPSQASLSCPRCGAQLEVSGVDKLLAVYTNTWTGQLVVGCGGLLLLGAAAAVIWYLLR